MEKKGNINRMSSHNQSPQSEITMILRPQSINIDIAIPPPLSLSHSGSTRSSRPKSGGKELDGTLRSHLDHLASGPFVNLMPRVNWFASRLHEGAALPQQLGQFRDKLVL